MYDFDVPEPQEPARTLPDGSLSSFWTNFHPISWSGAKVMTDFVSVLLTSPPPHLPYALRFTLHALRFTLYGLEYALRITTL